MLIRPPFLKKLQLTSWIQFWIQISVYYEKNNKKINFCSDTNKGSNFAKKPNIELNQIPWLWGTGVVKGFPSAGGFLGPESFSHTRSIDSAHIYKHTSLCKHICLFYLIRRKGIVWGRGLPRDDGVTKYLFSKCKRSLLEEPISVWELWQWTRTQYK
jgi:hypothetical protein